jgi:hypothetical protein
MHPAALNGLSALGLLFILGIVIVCYFIGLSISAFILKLACRTAGAEVPDTGKAMFVSFLESFVGGVLYAGSMLTAMFVGKATNAEQTTLAAFAGLSTISVTFLVPAGLYVPMLRVTFPKGVVISVLRYLITALLMAVFGILLMALVGTGKHH